MDTRASIESILDKIYTARERNDPAAAAECFTESGCFRANGGPPTGSRAEQTDALKQLFEAFELLGAEYHCRIIDPPRAAVHWRGKFRAKGTGQIAETNILDVIEVKDGRLASLTTFFDTALAQRMMAPS